MKYLVRFGDGQQSFLPPPESHSGAPQAASLRRPARAQVYALALDRFYFIEMCNIMEMKRRTALLEKAAEQWPQLANCELKELAMTMDPLELKSDEQLFPLRVEGEDYIFIVEDGELLLHFDGAGAPADRLVSLGAMEPSVDRK
jgi:hypothetical protein